MTNKIILPVSRDDVARLAEIAVELDVLKNRLPVSIEHGELLCLVEDLHEIAEALDAQNGFGIYSASDSAALKAAA